MIGAVALHFGEQAATNNAAEVQALLALMQWLLAEQARWRGTKGIVVRGDSKLIIDFCNRAARPGQQHQYLPMGEVKDIARQLPGRVLYRHIPREENNWADWLGRVAAVEGQTRDWTTDLQGMDAAGGPPCPPEHWVSMHAGTQEAVTMVAPPVIGGGLEAAIAAARKLQPEFADAHVCKVCLGRGGAK